MRITCLITLLLAALLFAACGGADVEDAATDASNVAGALDHVDGVVQLDGESLTITPTSSGEAMTFQLGPEVEVGAVRSLEASGSAARVYFRRGGEPLVAASVVAAPKVGEGLEAFEGTVSSVDAGTLVVKGAGGERSFDISASPAGVFDVLHLEDHASLREPIRVYYDPSQPDVGIAYEDA